MKDQRLYAMGDAVNEDVRLTTLGSRRGLLPWSRTKLTTTQVRNAMKHMDEGNADKALWSVNLALYLDPTMPEALTLKEQITGENFYYQEFSMLQKSIDDTIQMQMHNDLEGAIEPMPSSGQDEAPRSAPKPMADAAEMEIQDAATAES